MCRSGLKTMDPKSCVGGASVKIMMSSETVGGLGEQATRGSLLSGVYPSG